MRDLGTTIVLNQRASVRAKFERLDEAQRAVIFAVFPEEMADLDALTYDELVGLEAFITDIRADDLGLELEQLEA